MTDAPRDGPALEPVRSSDSARPPARLLVPCSDLMLTARLDPPARVAGFDLEVATSLRELETALTHEPPVLALLDAADATFPFAETHAIIKRLAPSACCLAIYPHVRADLRELAEQLGCDLVMPRSRFFTDIAASLRLAVSASRAHAAVAGDSR